MDNKPVVEIVAFKVTDPVAGMKAAEAIVKEAKTFNDGILSAELYQSASNPNQIAQRITWKNLELAKEAGALVEKSASMAGFAAVMTETVLFDHFYPQD